ncbi:VCBS repeat-containing protein [Streptomyces thermocoprophilus]
MKAQAHSDDAGIGIVYGSADGLTPGARRLISPQRQAARVDGQAPALFDAEDSCDLDGDGFTDLIVTTDPPYDGQGRPPVPLQVLFGSPDGLTGTAVVLDVPDRARYGNDWPDQPVCGDFDGDGAEDLVLHASEGRLSFLRGPFTREGSPPTRRCRRSRPRATSPPAPQPTSTATDTTTCWSARPRAAAPPGWCWAAPQGPTRTGTALPAGIDVALGNFGRGKALDAAVGTMGETSLRYDLPTPATGTLASPGSMLAAGDFDGDGHSDLVSYGSRLKVFRGGTAGPDARTMVTLRPPASGTTRVVAVGDFDGDRRADLVVRTYQGETRDTVAVYPGTTTGLLGPSPTVTFSTAQFLGM